MSESLPETPSISRRALMGGSAAVTASLAFQGLAQARSKSGSLTVGVNANLMTLDPADANDTLSQSAARLMLEGLLGFDKDMKVVPLLAETWQANEAATEFTFHLRKGIQFQDGTPFDAQAVKMNFERIANPANRLKRQGLLAMLDHVEVVDLGAVCIQGFRVVCCSNSVLSKEASLEQTDTDGRAMGADRRLSSWPDWDAGTQRG